MIRRPCRHSSIWRRAASRSARRNIVFDLVREADECDRGLHGDGQPAVLQPVIAAPEHEAGQVAGIWHEKLPRRAGAGTTFTHARTLPPGAGAGWRRLPHSRHFLVQPHVRPGPPQGLARRLASQQRSQHLPRGERAAGPGRRQAAYGLTALSSGTGRRRVCKLRRPSAGTVAVAAGEPRPDATGLVVPFARGDRTRPASLLYCAIGAGQTPSLPPAISLDLATAGHVASAYSEPGGELGEAREKRDEAARASE